MYPFNINNKPTADIDEWVATESCCLIGKVTNHPNQRSFRTDRQMTTPIIRIDPDFKWAETGNTFYRLGTRAASDN